VGKDEEPALAATITQSDAGELQPAPPTDKTTVKYEIAGEHARGGLGRVLRAWDRRLNRLVAIKELLAARADHARRFVREVEITARLQHPSIVPVYEAGEWPNGTPFFAMKFVSGRSLRQLIDDAGTLDKRLALLPNLIAAADAIAYAHNQGVLHRDLKPSNVVVGDFGETVVVDWGLAKIIAEPDEAAGAALDGDAPGAQTVAGAVLGTPSYMPPEQARGAPVDARADVYALGAMLYHVLAGVSPFSGDTSQEILEKVVAGPPIPVDERERGVPPDLAAIVRKAMARDPNDRYASAVAVAEDLRRFQTGQLVGAHHYSRAVLIRRWLRQQRSSVAVAGVLLAVLAISLTFAFRRIVRERDRAEKRSNELILAQARAQLVVDPTAALAWAKTYPLDGGDLPALHELIVDAESRGVARHVLRRKDLNSVGAVFSHDGTRLASEEGMQVRISDVATGRTLLVVPHNNVVQGRGTITWTEDDRSLVVIGWAPDTGPLLNLIDVASGAISHVGKLTRNVPRLRIRGDQAIVACSDGTVQLWDLRQRTHRIVAKHPPKVLAAEFSPDGTRIASGGADGRVAVSTGEGLLQSLDVGGIVTELMFTLDGKSIVFGQEDGRVWRWDLAGGKQTLLGRHQATVSALAWSGDGIWAATGSADRTVRLWNLRDGTTRVLAGHGGAVKDLAFTPDDTTLASSGGDGTVRLWDINSGAVTVLRGHTASVEAISFTRDGRWLVSSALDLSSRVWELRATGATKNLGGHDRDVFGVAYSRDGAWLASGGMDRTLRLWAVPAATTGAVHRVPGALTAVGFSPDSARVAAVGYKAVAVWDTRSGAEQLSDAPRGSAFWRFQFSPDGRRFAVSSVDGNVRVWTDGVPQDLRGARGVLDSLSFSPDGRSLAAGGYDKLVHIWDLTTGTARLDSFHTAVIVGVAFSPDGKVLASASEDARVHLHDLAGGADRTLKLSAKPHSITFSPSGRWLATACDQTLALFDRQTGRQRVLPGLSDSSWAIDFSPDEKLVVATSSPGTVRAWDTASGDVQHLYRVDTLVWDLAISPDGATIATGHQDGIVRLWPMPREYVPTTPEGLRGAMERATTAVLMGDPPVPQTK
jgi:WD40 repeat protein